MNEDDFGHKPTLKAISNAFYSDDTGSLFQSCIECEKELIESSEHYFIEKAIRRYPNSTETLTIFEFAICISCANQLNQSLSAESLSNITKFQKDKLRMRKIDSTSKRSEHLLSTCIFSGMDISQCEEYQIVGAFKGNEMIVSDFPFAISGSIIESMSEVLSPGTKGEFDDFVSKHFTGPPELQELWGKPKVILV